MKITGTALNTATKALLDVCSRRGIETDELLARAAISRTRFEHYNERIPIDKKNIIWSDAQARTGDRHIGLVAAESVPFGGYGVFDHLLLASATPKDALKRTSRFYRLLNNNAELSFQTHGKRLLIELYNPSVSSPENLGFSAEYSFAVIVLRFRFVVGNCLKPEKVYFTHPAPADISTHRRIFNAPLEFNQPVNRMVFRRELFDAPLPQSDAVLAEILENHAQRLLKRLPAEDDIKTEVREVLLTTLGDGADISLKATARQLAMSDRSLQRKLCGQGTSYRELLDELRYELAINYAAQQIEPSEIAYLLGFSETSAFQRAFKRWSQNDYQNSAGKNSLAAVPIFRAE